MRKITSLLVLFCMCVGMAWGQDVYRPGARTTTLEVGKKYFIGAATFYSDARYNLLYNNGGTLAYSDKAPSSLITETSYLFKVEKIDDNGLVYITNNQGEYLQDNNLKSHIDEYGMKIVPYYQVKGTIACGSDVQACDEKGNKIEYNNITEETPIVCVYANENNGWRHISGLQIGKSTPFAFYEVETQEGLVELTTNPANPIYYTIKNVKSGKFATYSGDNKQMKIIPGVSPDALFYFTAGDATAEGQSVVKIHNYSAGSKMCAGHSSWTDAGIDWYLKPQANGLSISNAADCSGNGTSWNNAGGFGKQIAYWNGPDDGSAWKIEKFEGEIPTFKTSTPENIVLCQINPVRQSSLVKFDGHNTTMKQVYNSELATYWYFIVDAEEQANAPEGVTACRIFTPLHETGLENHGSGFMGTASYPAKVYYIQEYENNGYKGYAIYPKGSNNGWNERNGADVCDYAWQNDGSVWNIYSTNKTMDEVKSEIKTMINNLGAATYVNSYVEADFYSVADDVKTAAQEKVTEVDQNAPSHALYATYLSHKAAKDLIASAEKTAGPVAGKYIQLKNRQYGKYLKPTDAGTLTSVADGNDWATLWLVVEGTDGNVMLQNASTEKYIGEIRQSKEVAMVEETNAKQFAFTNEADAYAVFKETSGGDYAYGHIAGHNVLVGWERAANATQWIVSEVTLEESLADLQEIYDVVDNAFGTEPGQYKEMEPSPSDELYPAWAFAGDVLGNDEAKDVYMISNLASDLKARWTAQLANPDSREINLPVQGKFYRLKNVASGRYMNVKDASNVVVTDEGENLPATIFYLGENNTMLSYSVGQYLDCGNKNLAAVGTSKSGEFAAARSGAKPNTIMYKNNGYWTFGDRANDVSIDRGSTKPGANAVGYDWTLQEVTTLPVKITKAGASTLYAPVALSLPKEQGLTVYTAEKIDDYLKLTEVEDVIPANTGVILMGNEGTYNFTISDETSDLVSDLTGTVAKKANPKDGTIYTLQKPDDALVMKMYNGDYLNGFKAYYKTDNSNVQALRLSFGETTGIETVVNGNENGKLEIYDMSGRRVEKMTKGLYIVNGQKVLVK